MCSLTLTALTELERKRLRIQSKSDARFKRRSNALKDMASGDWEARCSLRRGIHRIVDQSCLNPIASKSPFREGSA